jgi:uncharacterized membrane protein
MNLFPVILAANFLTLVVVIVAAIKFATWSYRVIALVALAAFLFALYQFQTGTYQLATLILTALLDGLIAARIFINRRKFKRR